MCTMDPLHRVTCEGWVKEKEFRSHIFMKEKKIEVLKKVRIFFGLKQKKLIGFGQVSSNLFIERMHLLKKKERKKFKTNQKVKI